MNKLDTHQLARIGAIARLKALDDEKIALMAFLGASTPKARINATKTATPKARGWSKAQHAKFRKTMARKGYNKA